MRLFDKLKSKAAKNRKSEEDLYASVAAEIVNGMRSDALWLKALGIANGSKEKQLSEYIKLRVQSLRDDVHLVNELVSTIPNANIEVEVNSLEKEVEQTPKPDWDFIIDYHPEISASYIRLLKISSDIAQQFKSQILASKEYSRAPFLANSIEDNYLTPIFGLNTRIHEFASWLISEDREDIFSELKSTVTALGDVSDSNKIIMRLAQKFDLDFMPREEQIKIAFDDFGSEKSNFSRLLDLNIDIVKIDGMFIKNIHNDEKSFKLAKAITNLAKDFGCEVVAECVENEESQKIIEELNIDYTQGFYYSKPSQYIE